MAAVVVVSVLVMQVGVAMRMLLVAKDAHEAEDGNHLFVMMMMGNDSMCQQTDVGKDYKEKSCSFSHLSV